MIGLALGAMIAVARDGGAGGVRHRLARAQGPHVPGDAAVPAALRRHRVAAPARSRSCSWPWPRSSSVTLLARRHVCWSRRRRPWRVLHSAAARLFWLVRLTFAIVRADAASRDDLARGGCMPLHGVARSYASASRNSVASSQARPVSCNPIGSRLAGEPARHADRRQPGERRAHGEDVREVHLQRIGRALAEPERRRRARRHRDRVDVLRTPRRSRAGSACAPAAPSGSTRRSSRRRARRCRA